MCYARRVAHFRMKGLRRLRDASAARCCSSDFFREAAAALRRADGTKFVLPAPAAGAGRFSAGGVFAAFPKLSQLFLGGGGGGGGAAGVFGAAKRLNGVGFAAGLLPPNEKAGFGAGFGFGAGVGFGAGFAPPKKLNAGLGAGVGLGAGFAPPNEKGAALGAGVGLGAGFGAGFRAGAGFRKTRPASPLGKRSRAGFSRSICSSFSETLSTTGLDVFRASLPTERISCEKFDSSSPSDARAATAGAGAAGATSSLGASYAGSPGAG